jgi:hypothetical protein
MSRTIKRKKINLPHALRDFGYTVRSFALQNGYVVSTTHAALNGTIDGPKARRILRHIKEVVHA